MKNVKLLLTLILSFALMFTLTACDKTSNFFLSMQDAASIKSYDYSTELTIAATDINIISDETDETSDAQIKLKLNGTILESGDLSADIFIGVDSSMNNDYIKMFQTDGEYINITDIILKDDTVYINIQKIIKLLDAFGFAEYAAMFQSFDVKYIQFELGAIEDYGLKIQSEEIVESAKAIEKIYLNLLSLIETTVKDVKPSVLSEKKGTFTFTLNNENIPAVIDSVINLIDGVTIDEFLDGSIKELESIDSEQTAEFIEELKQAKEIFDTFEFKEEAKAQLIELKNGFDESLSLFEIVGTSTLKGSDDSRKWDFTLNADYEQGEDDVQIIDGAAFNLSHSIKELPENSEIEIPNDFVSYEEITS